MKYIAILITLTMSIDGLAEDWRVSSGADKTMLIELYTSEGCSSCPPADAFLGQFTASDQLWTNYIPLAFHVDYWDYLGWQDTFGSALFSERQREHKQQQNISSVYTPGFVIDGKEWAGFFKPWRVLPDVSGQAGVLSASIDRHLVNLEFPPADQALKYNLAIIGLGLSTPVKSGENAGEQLLHDFVVLDHQVMRGKKSAQFELPLIVKHQPKSFGLVAWITDTNSLSPIQAVGGELPTGTIKQIN